MPFIPHSDAETAAMLKAINADSIKELFDEIPDSIPPATINSAGPGLDEIEMTRLMQQRQPSTNTISFLGAGSYRHHIPAAVWDIVGRGEYYTAYTPYQAEASQGSLQTIFEYQQMMTELMQMDLSNASLYDGATALAEACLMSVRILRGKKTKIAVPATLHPAYRDVLETLISAQGISLHTIPHQNGLIDQATFTSHLEDCAAVILAQPNFLGALDDVDNLTNIAQRENVLVIACVNPRAMAILNPPGQWGDNGADIVCGEGQPLGVPVMSGGPYFGFMCCRKLFARQLPGRIVGKTVDTEQKECYTLTLQAREQHIRRSKATSNICTNQGLLMVAATITMRLQGGTGLQQIAERCHTQASNLQAALCALDGVELVSTAPFFHEFIIRIPTASTTDLLKRLTSEYNIQGGYALEHEFPEFTNCLLVNATELNSDADINAYTNALQHILG
jgi:glycine dehydrogenase subunit 1